MTMSGTCTCGRFIWYQSKDELLHIAIKHHRVNEIKKYIAEEMPDGILTCPKCGKKYSEREFSELEDCMGYGEHAGYTRDPELAYQQAISNAYAVMYQAERGNTNFGFILILVGVLVYLYGTLLLM